MTNKDKKSRQKNIRWFFVFTLFFLAYGFYNENYEYNTKTIVNTVEVNAIEVNPFVEIDENIKKIVHMSSDYKKNLNVYTDTLFEMDKAVAGWQPNLSIELFPNLQVEPPLEVYVPEEKTMFLTFDDGPSDRTVEILDILKQYDIKATFFVTCQSPIYAQQKYIDILNRIVDEGHAIGLHTYTHEYNIYDTKETFLYDLDQIFNHIKGSTGVVSNIMRFAGGSINSFNAHIREELFLELENRGIVYYDWTASVDDSIGGNPSAATLFNNAKRSIRGGVSENLLMHDTQNKYNTVAALPNIINYCIDQGYKFEALTHNIFPHQF